MRDEEECEKKATGKKSGMTGRSEMFGKEASAPCHESFNGLKPVACLASLEGDRRRFRRGTAKP
jgi:hypothetical protein